MTKTVWKFQFNPEDLLSIQMPAGAKLLHVDVQGGQPCIWALVDPAAPTENRNFRLAGTGHPIEAVDCEVYFGTFMLREGALVFHLFDRGM